MRMVFLLAIAALLTAASPAAAQRVIGVESGAVDTLVCAEDRFLTGVVGREGARIDAIAITCSQMILAEKRAVRPGWINSRSLGGGGGRPKSVWCNDGLLPRGVTVTWHDSLPEITALRLNCHGYVAITRTLAAGSNICDHPAEAARAGVACRPSATLGHAPAGRRAELSDCAPGGVMVGLRVWHGRFVNAVQPICRFAG